MNKFLFNCRVALMWLVVFASSIYAGTNSVMSMLRSGVVPGVVLTSITYFVAAISDDKPHIALKTIYFLVAVTTLIWIIIRIVYHT